jgi:hypothetical protein
VRRGPQQLLDLVEATVEINELGAALAHELVVESVAPKHLDNEPAEVTQALVSHLQEDPPLAP